MSSSISQLLTQEAAGENSVLKPASVDFVTLRKAFNDILKNENSLSMANLKEMIRISDKYNGDSVYAVSENLNSANYQWTGDRPTLYAYNTSDGTYSEITHLDMEFSSCTQIYAKSKTNGPDGNPVYESIYSFYRMDPGQIFRTIPTGDAFDYADTVTKVTAALYSLACVQKKLIELHLADLEVIREEQQKLDEITNLLKATMESLNESDAAVSELSDLSTRTLDTEVWLYFLERKLLNRSIASVSSLGGPIISKSLVESLESRLDVPGLSEDAKKALVRNSAFARYAFPSDRVAGFADVLRVYTDQVNNESDVRSQRLTQIQQMAQQNSNTASSLMKSFAKSQNEVTANVR
jgi:hypothetical protein